MASSTPPIDQNGQDPLENLPDSSTEQSTASGIALPASSDDTKGSMEDRGVADQFDPQEIRILRSYGKLRDNVGFYKRLLSIEVFGNGPLYYDHYREFIENYARPSRHTDNDKGSVIKLERVLQVLKDNSCLKDGGDLFKDNRLLKDDPDVSDWGRKEWEARFFGRTFYANKQAEGGVFFGTGDDEGLVQTEMRKLWIVLLVRKYHWYEANPKTTPKPTRKLKSLCLRTFRQPTAVQMARRKSSGPNLFGGQLAVTWVYEGNRKIRSMLIYNIEYKEWEEVIDEICEGFGFVTDKALNDKEIMVAETAYDVRKRYPDDEMPDWSRLTEEHPQMTRGGWTKLRKCGAVSRMPIFVVIYSTDYSQPCTANAAGTNAAPSAAATGEATTDEATNTAATTDEAPTGETVTGEVPKAETIGIAAVSKRGTERKKRKAVGLGKARKQITLHNNAGEAAGDLDENISDDEEEKVSPKDSDSEILEESPGPSKKVRLEDKTDGETGATSWLNKIC